MSEKAEENKDFGPELCKHMLDTVLKTNGF